MEEAYRAVPHVSLFEVCPTIIIHLKAQAVMRVLDWVESSSSGRWWREPAEGLCGVDFGYVVFSFLIPAAYLTNGSLQGLALDPTSHILVFDALKCWRVNKTGNLIAASQIEPQDFIYVLTQRWVVE